jgi:CMP-N-acetylneuraminic acid synthetase/mannose-6-phosphate isomerase-like protein (cupin superfamily)
MKKVAMIPARLASERIKQKNLRLLKGKPLVSYPIEACIQSGVFDEIYVNSEAEIFREIAKKYGVKFYKRAPRLARSEVTSEQFVYDFLQNVRCDLLFQVLPTSPLLKSKDISAFVSYMVENRYDTLLSVKEERREALFRDMTINYSLTGSMPQSQDLEPVKLFCNAIMGWRASIFIAIFERMGCAVYGAGGKAGYFTLSWPATIDIDNEEDFRLAEAALEQRSIKPRYYLPSEKDGVKNNNLFDANKPKVNIEDIIAEFSGLPSWSKRVVNSKSNSVTLICQSPGEGNRLHYHADWDEWWLIIEGVWQWEIEGEVMNVKKGDLIFIERGKLHRITAVGKRPAIRMAVSREDVAHIYPAEAR